MPSVPETVETSSPCHHHTALAASGEVCAGVGGGKVSIPFCFALSYYPLGQITWPQDLYSRGKPSPEFKVRAEKRAKVIRNRAEIFNRKCIMVLTERKRRDRELRILRLFANQTPFPC